MQLRIPMAEWSSQEVASFLRLIYLPKDLTAVMFEAAAQMPAVVEMAHQLDVAELLEALEWEYGK